MDLATTARAFMGITLAFHIFFALFGVGIPLLLSLAEIIGIIKKDADFTLMARRWTFAMATLFVTGAISGTVVAVLLSVLLPPFMEIVSKVVILPFFIETFAFFIEAIFLGIYVYTWDVWKGKWTHWLCSLPIVVASAASAFLITTVNAWMTAPAGFTYVGGVVANVDPWAAMWNAAVPTRTTHSILSYYATTAFVFAAIAALCLFRRRAKNHEGGSPRKYYEKMLVFALTLAFIFSIATVWSGDSSVRYLAQNEPQKFAAAENLATTQSDAPLDVFGITLPGMLSVLMDGSSGVVVRGLDAFDPSTWPPLAIHYFFDVMTVVGILMFFVPLVFFVLRRIKKWRHWALSHLMLWAVFTMGVLSIVAVELGWMLTEIGRQPYTIRGVLLTRDAFTASSVVLAYAFVFPLFYLVLGGVTFWVLIRHYENTKL